MFAIIDPIFDHTCGLEPRTKEKVDRLFVAFVDQRIHLMKVDDTMTIVDGLEQGGMTISPVALLAHHSHTNLGT